MSVLCDGIENGLVLLVSMEKTSMGLGIVSTGRRAARGSVLDLGAEPSRSTDTEIFVLARQQGNLLANCTRK